MFLASVNACGPRPGLPLIKEYRERLKQVERRYFLHLTKSAFALRAESKEFWDFHRKGLASINYVFDWRKLIGWLPRAIVERSGTHLEKAG